MECTTLELLPKSKNRYRVRANIFNIKNKLFEKVTLFFDTGCYNTLVPKDVAITSGYPLNFKHSYKIGGGIVEAEAYLIEMIMLGGFAIKRIVAFAADYTGEFSSNILIGTNVMNNWKMTIDRKANLFQFCENPPDDLPNKEHIYQNYFDKQGNYMYAQDMELSLLKEN